MSEKIELLHHYEDEWKYRNTHYWKLVNRDIYSGIFIIMFPYLSSYLGVDASSTLNNLFFSIAGVVISGLFTFLLLNENARMATNRTVMNKLIKEIGGLDYLSPRVGKVFRVSIGKTVPFVIFLFHLLLAILY